MTEQADLANPNPGRYTQLVLGLDPFPYKDLNPTSRYSQSVVPDDWIPTISQMVGLNNLSQGRIPQVDDQRRLHVFDENSGGGGGAGPIPYTSSRIIDNDFTFTSGSDFNSVNGTTPACKIVYGVVWSVIVAPSATSPIPFTLFEFRLELGNSVYITVASGHLTDKTDQLYGVPGSDRGVLMFPFPVDVVASGGNVQFMDLAFFTDNLDCMASGCILGHT